MNPETTSEFLYTYSPEDLKVEWVKKSYMTKRSSDKCWTNDSGTVFLIEDTRWISPPPDLIDGGSMGHELVVFGEHFRTYIHSELELDSNRKERFIMKIALGNPEGEWDRSNMKPMESKPWKYTRTSIHPIFLQDGAEIKSYYAGKMSAEQFNKSKDLIRRIYQYTSIYSNLSLRNKFCDDIINRKAIIGRPITDDDIPKMLLSEICCTDPLHAAKLQWYETTPQSDMSDRSGAGEKFRSDSKIVFVGPLAN